MIWLFVLLLGLSAFYKEWTKARKAVAFRGRGFVEFLKFPLRSCLRAFRRGIFREWILLQS